MMDLSDAGMAAAAVALAMAVVRLAEKSILAALAKKKDPPTDYAPTLAKISSATERTAEIQERTIEKLVSMDSKIDAVSRSIEIVRERRATG